MPCAEAAGSDVVCDWTDFTKPGDAVSTILRFDHISVDALDHADLGRQITSLVVAKLAEYRAAREL